MGASFGFLIFLFVHESIDISETFYNRCFSTSKKVENSIKFHETEFHALINTFAYAVFVAGDISQNLIE